MQRAHWLQSAEKENSAALMGADQTVSSLQACFYLNWPSAGLQGVPSRISAGWISDPFCPYRGTGRMNFGSTCTEWIVGQSHRWNWSFQWDSTHRREQMCTIFTLYQWEPIAGPVAHNLPFQLFVQRPAHRGCNLSCKPTWLQMGACMHDTTHIKHNML